jgi:ABC-type branched-subunit amino acid transport system substrate-binding protein
MNLSRFCRLTGRIFRFSLSIAFALAALAVLSNCSTQADHLRPTQPWPRQSSLQPENPRAAEPALNPLSAAGIDTSDVDEPERKTAFFSQIERAPPSTPGVPAPGLTGAPKPDSRFVRIGLLLPLTGPNAPLGRALLDASLLALYDRREGRPALELLPRDTKEAAQDAWAAAEAALADGAQLLIGPVFSAATTTIAPLAGAYGVNVLSFSSDRAAAGNGVYLLGFAADQEIRRIVGFARSKGYKRFAALAPDDAYGQAVVAAVQDALQRQGGEIVAIERYPPTLADFSEPVKRLANHDARALAMAAHKRRLASRKDDAARAELKRLEKRDTLGEVDYDALLIAEGGAKLRALAPLLLYYDIDVTKVKLLGTGLWDEPGLGREPALIGAWFAGVPVDRQTAFRARFLDAFGAEPPRRASLAYDATALAAELAQNEGRFDRAALENRLGFSGFDGRFRFGPDGMAERSLAVIEIVDPPPGGGRDVRVIDPPRDPDQPGF